jgi:hypothetical protein
MNCGCSVTTVDVPRETFRLLGVKAFQLRSVRMRLVKREHINYIVIHTEAIEALVRNHSRIVDKSLLVSVEFLRGLRDRFHSLHSMLKSFPVSPPKEKAWMFLLCNDAMKLIDERLQTDLFKP